MKRPTRASLKRGSLLRLIGSVLTIGLLIYLLSQQGWGDILTSMQHIAAWRIALALLLMIVSRFAVSGRWYILLRGGGADISIVQSLKINFAGLFATNFLPTTVGGDVVRLAGALRFRQDAALCAASLIVDRLVGMAGMAMALPFGLPIFLSSQHLTRLTQPSLAVALPLSGWGRKLWNKGLTITQQIFAALGRWLHQPRVLLAALAFTWIHMACLFSILYLLFEGMDQSISWLMIGGLYSLVYFVTLLPFSINGYGLQEVSMTFVFSNLGGASLSSGLTAALIFRTLMMLASLPGALFVPEMVAGDTPGE